jgi:flagellar protein FlaJ
MSETGVSPGEMFKILSTTNIYGEIQQEAKKISKDINFMGVDNISAIERSIEVTPSNKFKSFLQGLLGTIQAGSRLEDFFSTMVQQYMEEDLIIREKNLEFLSLIAEMFVMTVIAFPLFLVIIISVMGFAGTSSATDFDILFLLSFVVLPFLYYAFLFLIKSTTIEEIGASKEEKLISFKQKIHNNIGSIKVVISSLAMVISAYILIYLMIYYNYFSFTIYNYIDLIFLTILLLIGPIAFYTNIKIKKKMEIQDRIPDFLVGVSNSLFAGLNIFDSIKMLSKRNYARLTNEIKKMSAELSWRLPIRLSFTQLSKRLKNPLIHRSVLSINRGLEMGGNTPKIFKAAAREIHQVNKVRKQRQANMSMYTAVIIMCFFVFLFIMIILNNTLFSYFFELQDLQQSGSQGFISQISSTHLNYGLFSFVFVQAIGSGILAGYFMDGSVSGGMRFSFLLGIVAVFVFKFLF